ncbi:hypothetical protein [Albimonas pacifica]|uniref:hypothetical protein n=1 Tax=Albimonas pacifica TaxID=1114924 RepID=UPI00116033A5|nr:hypothetical protein [Albimonas pacifica]
MSAPALLSGREARARVWTPALLVALALTLAVGLAGQLMLRAGLGYSVPALAESTRAGAAAVGHAVAGQFARARALGIPLERLPDAEAYLARIAAEAPQVRALALIDAQGRTLAATAPDIEGEAIPIRGAEPPATLVVAAASPLFDDAMLRLRVALWLAALLAGAAGGAITAGFLGLAQEPARRRLRRAVERAAEGDFAETPPPGARGRFAAAAEALARQVERVQAARTALLEAAATIRAIDFDGSLGRRIDPVLARVQARWTLPEREDDDLGDLVRPPAAGAASAAPAPAGAAGADAAAWRLAAALAIWAGAAPLVANFAVDRGALWATPAWQPVVPLLVELAALALGALVGRGAPGRSATLRALALALAGACLAATYWCRTWELFVALRLGAGLGAGFAGAALAGAFAPAASPRALRALLVFAALVAGPLIGGLAGEAVGRRAAFLALGVLALLAAPLLAAAGPGARAGPRAGTRAGAAPSAAARAAARGLSAAPALLAACAAAPAAAAELTWLPLGPGYDDYLAGGGLAAGLGLAALLAPRMPPAGVALALGLAAAARFAAEDWGPALGGPPPALAPLPACLLLGLALGAAAPARGGRGALLALAGGAAAGLLAEGLARQLSAPPGAATAAFAAAALVAALAMRPADRGRG